MGNKQSRDSSLSVASINSKVAEAQYAVRGEIVIRAQEIEQDLDEGKGSYPFNKVIFCNVGNPQQLGQKPITFLRNILALCDCPELMDDERASAFFTSEEIARSREYLGSIPGGTGAYSHSQGALICRQHVAEGIAKRDGCPCNPADIYLCDGASAGVHHIMRTLLRDERDCVLVPIPQYPLYSACMTLYGGTLLPYYLNESGCWSLDVSELRSIIQRAVKDKKCIRALAVINPGNPTGGVLDYDNIREVIKLCHEFGLVLLADEVYQENVYAEGKQFFSFKKVLHDMGAEFQDTCLISFHSTSKGFFGECGRRGGYMEIVNMPAEVRAQLVKLVSINLCPNVAGQIAVAVMMKPPEEGGPSYQRYMKERCEILDSLKRRAAIIRDALNQLDGVSCQEPQGALYAFPTITLPQGALDAAKEIGKPGDWLYAKELLEEKGIVIVPGSGFRQVDGTFHVRTTILPPESDIAAMAQAVSDFHRGFLKRYGGLPAAPQEPPAKVDAVPDTAQPTATAA